MEKSSRPRISRGSEARMRDGRTDLEIIDDAILAAMSTAGGSLANRNVCAALQRLTHAYGEDTRLDLAIKYMQSIETFARLMKDNLRKHLEQKASRR